MEPFKLQTIVEQKRDYVRALHRSYTCQCHRLDATHSSELERSQAMFDESYAVERKIDRMHDEMANGADMEFGADAWRRDKKLLKIVSDRMMRRSAAAQSRLDQLRKKAAAARAPYDKAIRLAKVRFEKLLKTVQ